jgi:hypothetical protein
VDKYEKPKWFAFGRAISHSKSAKNKGVKEFAKKRKNRHTAKQKGEDS